MNHEQDRALSDTNWRSTFISRGTANYYPLSKQGETTLRYALNV